MITVIGEALVDLVMSPGAASVAHPGGSPANVAVALARLGAPVRLLTRFGRDEYGALLLDHLSSNGVDLLGEFPDDSPTSVAEARLDDLGSATYTFRIAWDPNVPDLSIVDDAACVHTGSIAAVLEPGAAVVHRLMARARGRATVTYDPNCRPSLMGDPDHVRKVVEGLVAASDVVKVSDEDLRWLYPRDAYDGRARQWLELGPACVVVTRGGAGAYAVAAAGELERPAVAVELVDTVGAGDSFMAGLLDGLRRRQLLGAEALPQLARISLEVLGEIVDEASTVASITVSRAGADPPTRVELDAHTA